MIVTVAVVAVATLSAAIVSAARMEAVVTTETGDRSATVRAVDPSGFSRDDAGLERQYEKAAGFGGFFVFGLPVLGSLYRRRLAGHRGVALLNDAAAVAFPETNPGA